MATDGRDARLLAQLAERLEPRRPPFYVQADATGAPAGWYWVPVGASRPRWLGRNSIFAQTRLLELLREQDESQAA